MRCSFQVQQRGDGLGHEAYRSKLPGNSRGRTRPASRPSFRLQQRGDSTVFLRYGHALLADYA